MEYVLGNSGMSEMKTPALLNATNAGLAALAAAKTLGVYRPKVIKAAPLRNGWRIVVEPGDSL